MLALATNSFAEGQTLRLEWKEQSIRDAIMKYAEATAYWQSLRNQREAATALEAAGELHFVLSEYHQALDSYQEALAIRESLKDDLGIIEALDRIGYTFAYLGENRKALEYLERARIHLVKLRSVTQDTKRMEAQLLNSFGEVYYSLSDVKKALESFSRALTLWKMVGNREGEALASLNMGYMYHNFGDLKGAQDYYDQSLSIWSAAGNKRGEALTRTALGGLQSFLGEQQRALDLHNEALGLFRFIGDRQGEAATLNGIGTAYEELNKPQEALDNYDRASSLYHAIGNRDYEALAKFYMGAVHRTLGSTERARGYYNESISLLRSVGDRRIETYVLRDLATMYRSSGQTQKALNQYEAILKLYNGFEDKRGQANTLNSIGDIYNSSGQVHKALGLYKRALALAEASQDRGAEISTLGRLARAERDVGNISEALSRIEESIRIIESLRTKIAAPDLRASYFASVHQNYQQYIDMLMNMNRLHPEENFAEAALYVSERSRARSLIEMLAEARVDLRRGAGSALVEQADALERSLDAKAEYQMRVLSGTHSKGDQDEIDKEIRELERQYDQVQSRIREESAFYLTLSQPKLLRLQEIQTELKDDSLLLEYALGDERSYLWAVTSDSCASYELPGRKTLEDEALEVYGLLTARQPQKGETQLQHDDRVAKSDALYWAHVSKLSDMLLGPAASQLGKRRLIIVVEGVLQYIPFEILPINSLPQNAGAYGQPNHGGLPESSATLVVAEHEVVYLQSASMLSALQKKEKLPKSRQKDIIIMADPVFTQDDSRVPPRARETASPGIPETAELRRSLRDIDGQNGKGDFSRLLSTLQEAKMIVEAAPRGSTEVITGFQANKPSAMNGTLGEAKILHFATHGIINDEHPELSGIVLSLVDQQGNPQSGFLRLSDIYGLNLASDLVVLSACRSGLGKPLNGEGFVGLTRGFMSAGSRSVIASLWKVDDEATAELMGHFYDAMLRQGLPPAAALQKAKQAMQSNPTWHHPYYWAGFVLQGEFRERITVEGSSTASVMIIIALGLGLAISGFFVLRRMTRRQN